MHPVSRGLECPKYTQLIQKKSTKSLVWNYYGLPANEEGNLVKKSVAICKLCKFPVSCKEGSTSNLLSHIKCYHALEFVNLNKAKSMHSVPTAINVDDNTQDTNPTSATGLSEMPPPKKKTLLDFQSSTSKKIRARTKVRKILPSEDLDVSLGQIGIQISSYSTVDDTQETSDLFTFPAKCVDGDIPETHLFHNLQPVSRGLECPKYTQLIKKKNSKSPVWNYYGLPANEEGNLVTENVAICKLCKFPVSSKGGSTTNLISHIRCHHALEFVNLKKALSGHSVPTAINIDENTEDTNPTSPTGLSEMPPLKKQKTLLGCQSSTSKKIRARTKVRKILPSEDLDVSLGQIGIQISSYSTVEGTQETSDLVTIPVKCVYGDVPEGPPDILESSTDEKTTETSEMEDKMLMISRKSDKAVEDLVKEKKKSNDLKEKLLEESRKRNQYLEALIRLKCWKYNQTFEELI